ncbi:MAG: heme-binding beta-barrel domain-containing protein [Gammaproteobacteria bacterium]
MNPDIENLGPLAPLAGIWEGDKGTDVAPDDDRVSEEINKYRERILLEPIGDVENHEQLLYGLRYSTLVWRIGADEAFHEEVGYWLWDAANKQVIKSFVVPRGYTVMAGGTAKVNAKKFSMVADLGSETYGICSNQWLANEFKTTRFELNIEVHDNDSWSYDEDTVIEIKGVAEPFHHRDQNTLQRVGSF